MALVPYCSNDEVRAALGVTVSELADSVLDLPIYEIGLRRELLKVASTLPSDFSTAYAIPQVSRTTKQQALVDCTHTFVTLSVARQVGSTLGMFAPKTLTDDKAAFGRFTDAAYKDTLATLELLYQASRTELVSASADYLGSNVVSNSVVSFIATKRSYDPISG